MAVESWTPEFLRGVQERAASRATAPLTPLVKAARRVARLPTMNCSGAKYQERRLALAELRAALKVYDEATS